MIVPSMNKFYNHVINVDKKMEELTQCNAMQCQHLNDESDSLGLLTKEISFFGTFPKLNPKLKIGPILTI